jgi:hypothetical protein
MPHSHAQTMHVRVLPPAYNIGYFDALHPGPSTAARNQQRNRREIRSNRRDQKISKLFHRGRVAAPIVRRSSHRKASICSTATLTASWASGARRIWFGGYLRQRARARGLSHSAPATGLLRPVVYGPPDYYGPVVYGPPPGTPIAIAPTHVSTRRRMPPLMGSSPDRRVLVPESRF